MKRREFHYATRRRGGIRRRDFIKAVGGIAAAWPLVARAQQAAMPVIGFLNTQSPETYVDLMRAFRQGLKDTGFSEGENLTIEYRRPWRPNWFAAVLPRLWQPEAPCRGSPPRQQPRRFPSSLIPET